VTHALPALCFPKVCPYQNPEPGTALCMLCTYLQNLLLLGIQLKGSAGICQLNACGLELQREAVKHNSFGANMHIRPLAHCFA
jgi:hypothetical protein